MRRLYSVLLVLLLTSTLFAQNVDDESRLRELANPGARLGRAMILAPAKPLDDADRRHLASNGVSVQQALSGGRYIVRVREGALLDDDRIAALEPLTVEKKIHASARRAVRMGSKRAEVHVVFHKDVTFEDARAALLASGGRLRNPLKVGFSPTRRLSVVVPPAALEALAADERVLTVIGEPKLKVENHNAASAAASRVNEVHAAPYGLTGAGVAVSLFELAPAQLDHPEFGGRLTVNALGGDGGHKAHATHVAGTIGASGVNPQAKGMAPGALIHQFCVATDGNDCEGAWLDIKDDSLAPLGIVADNNSWGYKLGWDDGSGTPIWDGSGQFFGAYWLVKTAPLDEISINRNVLFVHSSGNQGGGVSFGGSGWSEHRHADDNGDPLPNLTFCYSKNGSGSDCPATPCNGGCEAKSHQPNLPFNTLGVTAAAKNVIAVGAVGSAPAHQIAGFSSRGPAQDGRIKPEVVARGLAVLSSVPTSTYASFHGTSMSAPAVTGIAALLVEQYRKLHNNQNPSPELLKALLIAGTRDLGNPGPDYTYGFGIVDAKNSVDALVADGGRGDRIRSLTFNQGQGQTFETAVNVTAEHTLRVVLNWADPSIPYLGGDDELVANALVNDLDLKVIDPAGNTWLPYVLNKSAVTANASRGVNTVDNVEMVEIPNAGPGAYRVVATGTRVTEGPQKAVLVTSATAGLTAAPCRDPQEVDGRTNESPQSAVGNLVPNSLVRAAICSAADVDFYTFVASKAGPITISIAAKDTPLRATLTGSGINATVDVAANTVATLSANASSVPVTLLFRVEATGPIGTDSNYSFIPTFSEAPSVRRRSTRH